MDFRQARSEYLHLRHAYRSGQISPDEFEKEVNSIIVRSKEQTWTIGVKTGKWYRREGKTWIEDIPDINSADDTVKTQVVSNKNKQTLKNIIKAVYTAKPSESAQEKSFRKIVTGFSIVFVILLISLLFVSGLTLAGVITSPITVGSIFSGNANTAEEVKGIFNLRTNEENVSLSSNLIVPENGIIIISGDPLLTGFLYTDDIQGTWLHQDGSDETLEFDKNGNIRIYSGKEGYQYAGKYSFIDNDNINIQTDGGSINTELWIDDGIMILIVNEKSIMYDKVD